MPICFQHLDLSAILCLHFLTSKIKKKLALGCSGVSRWFCCQVHVKEGNDSQITLILESTRFSYLALDTFVSTYAGHKY